MKRQTASHTPVPVAILLPPAVMASYVYLTQEMLLLAGTMQARSADVMASRLFDIDLVSVDGLPVHNFAGAPIAASATLNNGKRYAYVMVPAQFAPQRALREGEAELTGWLREQYAQGATLVALNGAPLLAKAGLLSGRIATGMQNETRWFRQYFPDITFAPTRPMVVDERLITITGINAAVDACAYVIDQRFGAGVSQRILRVAVNEVLPGYAHLAAWTRRFRQHGDAQILSVQDRIERELADLSAAAALAAQAAMSERTLSRRFQAATGHTLREYVALLRLEMAAFLLRSTRMAVSHVASECGFGSASALGRAFQDRFDASPLAYRKRMSA
ncbi:helix-turn-helix domain-containing protein [Burkholderiaceae bacterium DAT-1]|nr:helix-turn-helix domain-containing protein [Burkholderiaceae bacterium DAT-1]